MVTHQKPPSDFKEMNRKIGYKYVCLYKKERELRTGTKFAGDEILVLPISISAIFK